MEIAKSGKQKKMVRMEKLGEDERETKKEKDNRKEDREVTEKHPVKNPRER